MEKRKIEIAEVPGPLERLLGNVTARLLDFLILHRDWAYSLTDLAKNAGVGWGSVNRILPSLKEYGIVREARRKGRIKLYQLDQKSPISRSLIKAYMSIAHHYVEKELEAPRAVKAFTKVGVSKKLIKTIGI